MSLNSYQPGFSSTVWFQAKLKLLNQEFSIAVMFFTGTIFNKESL